MFAGTTGITHAEQGEELWSMVDAWRISLTCRYSLSRGFRGINATVYVGYVNYVDYYHEF
jgi:hypothetical protein